MSYYLRVGLLTIMFMGYLFILSPLFDLSAVTYMTGIEFNTSDRLVNVVACISAICLSFGLIMSVITNTIIRQVMITSWFTMLIAVTYTANIGLTLAYLTVGICIGSGGLAAWLMKPEVKA